MRAADVPAARHAGIDASGAEQLSIGPGRRHGGNVLSCGSEFIPPERTEGERMERLARRIGLGLAARGEVDRAVAWSVAARRAGLDSIWIHDSYFERDAVSYVAAIAAE